MNRGRKREGRDENINLTVTPELKKSTKKVKELTGLSYTDQGNIALEKYVNGILIEEREFKEIKERYLAFWDNLYEKIIDFKEKIEKRQYNKTVTLKEWVDHSYPNGKIYKKDTLKRKRFFLSLLKGQISGEINLLSLLIGFLGYLSPDPDTEEIASRFYYEVYSLLLDKEIVDNVKDLTECNLDYEALEKFFFETYDGDKVIFTSLNRKLHEEGKIKRDGVNEKKYFDEMIQDLFDQTTHLNFFIQQEINLRPIILTKIISLDNYYQALKEENLLSKFYLFLEKKLDLEKLVDYDLTSNYRTIIENVLEIDSKLSFCENLLNERNISDLKIFLSTKYSGHNSEIKKALIQDLMPPVLTRKSPKLNPSRLRELLAYSFNQTPIERQKDQIKEPDIRQMISTLEKKDNLTLKLELILRDIFKKMLYFEQTIITEGQNEIMGDYQNYLKARINKIKRRLREIKDS